MHNICCISVSPSLLSDIDDYSSNEDVSQNSSFLFKQKLSLFVKRFDRHVNFIYNKKNNQNDLDDSFEIISLPDDEDVSY